LTATPTDELWRRAHTEWAGISNKFPDLGAAVAVQQAILRLLIDARERLDDSRAALPDTAPARVLEKWSQGLPAFRNETIPIPDALKPILPALCAALASGGAGDSAAHIGDALTGGEIDAGSLLRVSLARNQKAIRTSALHHGFSPDLVWVIGELGSSPLANYCQTALLKSGDLGTGIRTWDRGYCPCCGSWPALIEGVARERWLRCSYCSGAWELKARRCVYCAQPVIVAAPDMAQPDRLVELCESCGGYTKVISVAAQTPFPLIAIKDLATMDLDEGAMTRGYLRPDLFDLDVIDPPAAPNCG
jgi:Protein involved in formate dehydrogenase formation